MTSTLQTWGKDEGDVPQIMKDDVRVGEEDVIMCIIFCWAVGRMFFFVDVF